MASSFTYKSQRFEISADVLQQNKPDSTILCIPYSEDQYFEIDGVAHEMWKLINQEQSVESTLSMLADKHKTSPDVMIPEVEKFINNLLEFQIISRIAP